MTDTYIKQSDAINDIFDQQITITNDLTEMDKVFNTGLRRAMSVLANLPAADVVPVVRCGKCKHCVEHHDMDGNAPYWVCKEWDSGTDYDGYCYRGA